MPTYWLVSIQSTKQEILEHDIQCPSNSLVIQITRRTGKPFNIPCIPVTIVQIIDLGNQASPSCSTKQLQQLGLLLVLSRQKIVSLLQGNTLSGELVIGGKPRGVSRLGDFTVVSNLLQGVDALAVAANSVHQVHLRKGSLSKFAEVHIDFCDEVFRIAGLKHIFSGERTTKYEIGSLP